MNKKVWDICMLVNSIFVWFIPLIVGKMCIDYNWDMVVALYVFGGWFLVSSIMLSFEKYFVK